MNMNTVSADIHSTQQGNAAASRSRPRDEETSVNAPEKTASRWDTTDTVDISDDARAALQTSQSLPYTKEDLAPLKDRFALFRDTENSIHSRLTSIMSKLGLKSGVNNQVKVEIDSHGKAIVGGITDVKAARALEKAINSDKDLLKDIVSHQKEEKKLSLDMREVTGMSLEAFASEIDNFQKAGVDVSLDMDRVDAEFAGFITEHYSKDVAAADISGRNNILEDAEGTVNRTMSKVTGDITEAFAEYNKKIRKDAGEMADSQQYLEDSLVDIKRLKISVDNTGKVTIEGKASKNNAVTDRTAKAIVESMFEEELKANPTTGKQHDFKTAATYLLNTYDETFGEGNPLGLGEDARKLETVYDHGKIESHVSSPEREAELTEEIDKSVKEALKDMGVDARAFTIEMNDKGELAATNLDPNAPNAQKVLDALDILNTQLENRSIEDAREEETTLATDPVKRLKGLMANMDVLRPGGAGLLKRAETPLLEPL